MRSQNMGESNCQYALVPQKNQHMKPGTKVICVDGTFHPLFRKHVQLPQKGKTYTIRDLVPDPFGQEPPKVTLKEIVNRLRVFDTPRGKLLKEPSFERFRFKPVNRKEAETWEVPSFNISKPAQRNQN